MSNSNQCSCACCHRVELSWPKTRPSGGHNVYCHGGKEPSWPCRWAEFHSGSLDQHFTTTSNGFFFFPSFKPFIFVLVTLTSKKYKSKLAAITAQQISQSWCTADLGHRGPRVRCRCGLRRRPSLPGRFTSASGWFPAGKYARPRPLVPDVRPRHVFPTAWASGSDVCQHTRCYRADWSRALVRAPVFY